jgi:two-component system sensor histidine kinase BaeS
VTVSQRLYLAVAPAIIGVFAVAGLAYWGEFGRRAPHVLVIVGVIASVASLIVAWRNTRYVATRVSRLAAPAQIARIDELDTIEEEVQRLQRAVNDAEAARAQAQAVADQRVQDYAALIGDAAASVARQLDEVRIPLHILLESHFGDLNENQEEMLAAARAAADDVHTRLDRLRAVADVDRGALRLRPERIRLADIVAVLMPGLTAAGGQTGVTLASDMSPLQGAVIADRAWLSEALSLLANDAVRRTPAGGEVRIGSVEPDAAPSAGEPPAERPVHPSPAGSGPAVRLLISHGLLSTGRPIDNALAERLIAAQGGQVQQRPDGMLISLPIDPTERGLRSAAAGVPHDLRAPPPPPAP